MSNASTGVAPGLPNWHDVQKLREDLRNSQRECNLLLGRIDYLKNEVADLRSKASHWEADAKLMDWLSRGDVQKRLELLLEAWKDDTLALPPDIRVVMTHVAKAGAR